MNNCNSNIPKSQAECDTSYIKEDKTLGERISQMKKNKYWDHMKKQTVLFIHTGQEYTFEELDKIINN